LTRHVPHRRSVPHPLAPSARSRHCAAITIGGRSETSPWARTRATSLRTARRFLKTTMPSWSATVEGLRVAAHHAQPSNDMHGIMPDASADELHTVLAAADADVLVVCHTHVAMDLRLGERMIVNPGALLREPADGWEGELPTRNVRRAGLARANLDSDPHADRTRGGHRKGWALR